MSRERRPRCDRCGRRWTKDPKPVRLRWLDVGEHRCVCPDCQTGAEQLRDAITKNLIDPGKVEALRASGEFPTREEDFDLRTVLRDDLDEDTLQVAGNMLLDLDGDGICDRCGEVEATRRGEAGQFCDHCARVLVEALILEMEDEGLIEIDGDMVRWKGTD